MTLAGLQGDEGGKNDNVWGSKHMFSPIIFTVKYFQLLMPLEIYLVASYVLFRFSLSYNVKQIVLEHVILFS